MTIFASGLELFYRGLSDEGSCSANRWRKHSHPNSINYIVQTLDIQAMPVVGSGSRSRIAGTDGASACWLCLGVASVLVRWIPGHGFSSLTRTRSDTKAWLRTTSGSSVLPSRSLAVAPISAPEGSSTPVLGAVLAASAAGALAAVHRQ
ncbi:unnamed protein product, partial [Polarella glacialis]